MYQAVSQALQDKNSKQYEILVFSLIQIKNMVDQFKQLEFDDINQKSAMDLETNRAQRAIEDIVTSIANN